MKFVILRDNLADTPKEELVKIVSYLWKDRYELNVGEHKEIGLSYKISLHRTAIDDFFFIVMGVTHGDDTKTISDVIEEITQ